LDDLGFSEVPILSPNSQDGYADFGLEGTDFRKVAWRGLVFVDCLAKMLHATRPYERDKGCTEKLYLHFLGRLDKALVNDEPLERLADEAARAFMGIETVDSANPVVGVVGEIYLRNNRFSNNFLIEKLERLGLEVRLATFCEWPMYTSNDFRRDSFLKKDWRGWIAGSLQVLVQGWHEHRLHNAFAKHVPISDDGSVEKTLELASEYLPRDCKGEAILSIGKAIEMVHDGASGIVNAMPFNCMPGTTVSALSKKVAQDLGEIPWLNISYEGLRDSGEETRLEAFAEQVKATASLGRGVSVVPKRSGR
jgi:predicted nucleotide-binding protein (sugar kinase/HSP70/actin superfamily)